MGNFLTCVYIIMITLNLLFMYPMLLCIDCLASFVFFVDTVASNEDCKEGMHLINMPINIDVCSFDKLKALVGL